MEVIYKTNISDKAKSFIDKTLNQYNVESLESIELKRVSKVGTSGLCFYPISTRKVNKFKKLGRKLKARKYYHIICRVGEDTKYPYEERQYIGCQVPRNYIGNPSLLPREALEWIYDQEICNSEDELMIWVFGHEIFHFLRKTKQVPGRNTQSQANKFGFELLRKYKS